MQDVAYLKVEYPFIFGTDVAGTIAELGSNVTKFKVGDRVLGHCDSLITLKATNAGFQRYSTVRAILTTAIPDSLPFANASVLPLGFDTAADALFAQLKLPLPSLSPKPVDKTVFIWGGSSSCGSCAIQLAVAAGWRVATTASKANFEYVKSLGASEVFDHRDSDVVEQIVKTLKPGDLVTDMIGSTETQTASAAVLSAIGGGLLPVVLWPAEHKYENVKLSIGEFAIRSTSELLPY
jgi:NADPH:quinone reductase-like Zn-dependent oxidoreductase